MQVTWFDRRQQGEARVLRAQRQGSRLLSVAFQASAPASKLSFHGRHPSVLQEAMRRVAEELGPHASLEGFALHSYEGLRLLSGDNPSTRPAQTARKR